MSVYKFVYLLTILTYCLEILNWIIIIIITKTMFMVLSSWQSY